MDYDDRGGHDRAYAPGPRLTAAQRARQRQQRLREQREQREQAELRRRMEQPTVARVEQTETTDERELPAAMLVTQNDVAAVHPSLDYAEPITAEGNPTLLVLLAMSEEQRPADAPPPTLLEAEWVGELWNDSHVLAAEVPMRRAGDGTCWAAELPLPASVTAPHLFAGRPEQEGSPAEESEAAAYEAQLAAAVVAEEEEDDEEAAAARAAEMAMDDEEALAAVARLKGEEIGTPPASQPSGPQPAAPPR